MNRYLALVAFICGCTTIDYKDGPVSGLEDMTVEEHHVDATEIYQRCSRCGSLGLNLLAACTCINFRTKHAVIWVPYGASQETIEHERAHGRGYDHPDGALRRQYATWVASGGRRTAPPIAAAEGTETGLTKVSVTPTAVSSR